MILLYKEDQGVVFTLDEFNELLYAPIYTDGSINLNEFDVVKDVDGNDELEEIQDDLIYMTDSQGL